MKPSNFIQWKGTDVCIDIWCACGHQYHFDGLFMYAVKCSKCGRIYEMDTRVKMKEVKECDYLPVDLIDE